MILPSLIMKTLSLYLKLSNLPLNSYMHLWLINYISIMHKHSDGRGSEAVEQLVTTNPTINGLEPLLTPDLVFRKDNQSALIQFTKHHVHDKPGFLY